MNICNNLLNYILFCKAKSIVKIIVFFDNKSKREIILPEFYACDLAHLINDINDDSKEHNIIKYMVIKGNDIIYQNINKKATPIIDNEVEDFELV